MSPSTTKDNSNQRLTPIILLVIVFLSACSTNSIKQELEVSAPSWYHNLSAQQGRIIGYGRGSDPRTAKNDALADLSEQLEVEVKTQTSLLIALNVDMEPR